MFLILRKIIFSYKRVYGPLQIIELSTKKGCFLQPAEYFPKYIMKYSGSSIMIVIYIIRSTKIYRSFYSSCRY